MVNETRLVAPTVDTGARGDSSGWSGSLPDDVLQATAHRLVLFCGVAAASWVAAVVLEHVLARPGAVTPFPWPGDLIAGIVVAILLAAQATIRRRVRSNCALTIDLGLGLVVINAIGVAVLNTWVPLPEPIDTRFVSWIAIVILAHAMIAPSTPARPSSPR